MPIEKFIDAFLIGDGEDVILEVCQVIKDAKKKGLARDEKNPKLSEIEGVFVPALHKGKKVRKRIAQIDYDNALRLIQYRFHLLFMTEQLSKSDAAAAECAAFVSLVTSICL